MEQIRKWDLQTLVKHISGSMKELSEYSLEI